MINVRALQKMYYNKREYQPGEEYAMDNREESEIKILVALGKVEIVPKSQVMTTRAMQAEEPPAEVQKEEPQKPSAEPMKTEGNILTSSPSRRYRRRDMKAE